ncbi:MAG: hypothetical protein FWH17_10795 [Oscillospiraceae bacterium]|nr:hypothetical protein [Oscillospiraceae bacterium]
MDKPAADMPVADIQVAKEGKPVVVADMPVVAGDKSAAVADMRAVDIQAAAEGGRMTAAALVAEVASPARLTQRRMHCKSVHLCLSGCRIFDKTYLFLLIFFEH